MAKRKPEPVQDGLDLGAAFEVQAPAAPRKKASKRGYVRQEHSAHPPVCGLCIDEMYVTKTRRVSAPNRVTHRVWITEWPTPMLMCAEHAHDYAAKFNLGRTASRKGQS